MKHRPSIKKPKKGSGWYMWCLNKTKMNREKKEGGKDEKS